MALNRWQQIEEIFQSALDLNPAEREKYVEKETGGDTELKKEVGKLLADYDSAEDFIESPIWTDSRFLNSVAKNEIENSLDKEIQVNLRKTSLLGRRIGVYELKDEIGRGGMGAVYLAMRADGEFRQKVAIKLIKRGMDTDFVLSRFRNERQILANLNHPNIVLLLDGGTTEDGLPYFVMDYIEGEPLYKYCNEKNLTLRQRLELFQQVCEAVDYAHRKKIVHRDLKPSNILINDYGIPKLLDFGIAKILDPELANDSLIPTETHMRLMTPEYASPEQVSGSEITPASDVYSLGVLLYELVTGKRPYKFPTRAPHEVARIICEEEPVKPSEVAEGDTQQAEIKSFDKDQRLRIKSQLNEEIDKIILKALRKNPAERYKTAADLAEDIRLFLENRPVKAELFQPFKPKKSTTTSSEQSVAILPFKIFAVREQETIGDDEYLGIGLADALVMRLSGVDRLIVRPTSSVLRYGGDANPFTAGRELGVDFIVEGTIRRVGDRIRVTVQLLNVAQKATRWAEKFNEKFNDVLELEDSISEKIAVSLLPYLTGEERQRLEKRGTNNAQAYEAYLRGRFFLNQFTPDSLPKALASFQTAVSHDSNYAQAYVAIADFYEWGNIYGILPPSECYPQIKNAASRALEIDDSLGEAHASMALYHQCLWNWTEADSLYKRALQLTPNYALAHEWYCSLLIATGRIEEGLNEARRSLELDPLSLRAMTLYAWYFYQARQFDESIHQARQIIEMDKNYPQGYIQLGNNLVQTGRVQEAIETLQKGAELMPNSALPKYPLCFALVKAGENAEAREVLNQIIDLDKNGYIKPYFRAMGHAALGETEKAFEYFEKSAREYDPWLAWLGTEPKLDFLRGEKRFIELFKHTANPLAFKQRFHPAQVEAESDSSIAVLPLKMLGEWAAGETGEEFLGIGLADSLIMRLNQLRDFIVRPTSSIMRYNKREASPFEAGRELDVRYVLDGNIRRDDKNFRITLQLLDVKNESIVWAEKFGGATGDIFTLEDEISEQVARSILPQISTAEQKRLVKHGTDNTEAYENYLRGRFHWNQFSFEGFSKAFTFYQRAIEIAPDYALAHTGLADYYNFLGVYTVKPFAETSLLAKEYALRAVSLDSSLAEAYAALGFAVLMHDFEWKEAEKHLRRALELNPNYVLGRVWYCYFLGMQKRFDEAFEQIHYALKLDSLTPIVPQTLNWTYYYSRRYEESIAASQSLIEREPNYGLSHIFLSSVLPKVGKYDEAITVGQKAVQLLGRNPYTLTWLAAAFAAANRRQETLKLLEEISRMSQKHYASPYLLAMVYCNLRDKEQTLAHLEKALAIRDARLMWLGVDPIFDFLRGDSRFQDLFRRTGNPLAF